jgi:hypothetical protein
LLVSDPGTKVEARLTANVALPCVEVTLTLKGGAATALQVTEIVGFGVPLLEPEIIPPKTDQLIVLVVFQFP